MTEKLLTFPSPTSQDLVDGVNRSKFNFFFSEQHQHKPTDIRTRTTCADPGNFFQGEGGSRLLNLFYILQRGSNGFVTHFPGGGGTTFSRGGGSKC